MSVGKLVEKQGDFFSSNQSKDIRFRIGNFGHRDHAIPKRIDHFE